MVNLLNVPTSDTGAMSTVGRDPRPWLESRVALEGGLNEGHVLLAAWGGDSDWAREGAPAGSGPLGGPGVRVRDIARWTVVDSPGRSNTQVTGLRRPSGSAGVRVRPSELPTFCLHGGHVGLEQPPKGELFSFRHGVPAKHDGLRLGFRHSYASVSGIKSPRFLGFLLG